MKAFEVYVNGQYALTAGIGHSIGVLHLILEIHGGILNHIIKGVDLATDENIFWNAPSLKVGDEITVKVIETDHVSPGDRRPCLGVRSIFTGT